MFFLNNIGLFTDLHTHQTYTRQQILRQIQIRAEEFSKSGLKKNDRVLLLHANSITFFIDLLAIWTNEACAVPIDSSNPTLEIEALRDHCLANFQITETHPELQQISSRSQHSRHFFHGFL